MPHNKRLYMYAYILVTLVYCVLVCGDPLPSGGAPCNTIADCNQQLCHNLTCRCDTMHGNPDCSYLRYSKVYIGGLQLLALIGIGGMGHLIMGQATLGLSQLITLLIAVMLMLLLCLWIRCDYHSRPRVWTIPFKFILVVAILAFGFYGFAGSLNDGRHILAGNIADVNGYDFY